MREIKKEKGRVDRSELGHREEEKKKRYLCA